METSSETRFSHLREKQGVRGHSRGGQSSLFGLFIVTAAVVLLGVCSMGGRSEVDILFFLSPPYPDKQTDRHRKDLSVTMVAHQLATVTGWQAPRNPPVSVLLLGTQVAVHRQSPDFI